MNLEKAISDVESVNFSIRMNVVSSLITYLNALWSEESIRVLYKAMACSEGISIVSSRLASLIQASIDPDYENPHDVALSVYTLLFHWSHPDSGKAVAEMVSRVGQCWWAARVAKAILEGSGKKTRELSIGRLGSKQESHTIKTTTIDKQVVWRPALEGKFVIVPHGRIGGSLSGNSLSPSGPGVSYSNWKEIKAA